MVCKCVRRSCREIYEAAAPPLCPCSAPLPFPSRPSCVPSPPLLLAPAPSKLPFFARRGTDVGIVVVVSRQTTGNYVNDLSAHLSDQRPESTRDQNKRALPFPPPHECRRVPKTSDCLRAIKTNCSTLRKRLRHLGGTETCSGLPATTFEREDIMAASFTNGTSVKFVAR